MRQQTRDRNSDANRCSSGIRSVSCRTPVSGKFDTTVVTALGRVLKQSETGATRIVSGTGIRIDSRCGPHQVLKSNHPQFPPPHPTLATISHRCGTAVKWQVDALVAQLDRVAASEAAGRWFESSRARHSLTSTPSPHAPIKAITARRRTPPLSGKPIKTKAWEGRRAWPPAAVRTRPSGGARWQPGR